MNPKQPTIGIVTALEMERRWLRPADDSFLVEVGGMGRVRAEAAATRLLDRGVSALVSWGNAGGLDPSLTPGVVVVPEIVVCGDVDVLPVDAGWRDRLLAKIDHLVPTSVGPMLHADEVVTSPERKRELYERRQAAAVDMESAGVGRVAKDVGVPWLVVRVVGDTVDHELPTAVTRVADDKGRLRPGAVLGLVVRPGLWPALVALGRANGAAGRSMRRVWGATGPDLGLGENPDQ